jgi:hypothetical protein
MSVTSYSLHDTNVLIATQIPFVKRHASCPPLVPKLLTIRTATLTRSIQPIRSPSLQALTNFPTCGLDSRRDGIVIMQNQNGTSRSRGGLLENIVVAPQAKSAQSDNTTQDRTGRAEAIALAEPTPIQHEAKERPFARHSWARKLTRLLSSRVPLWSIILLYISVLSYLFHMVTYHGWPWNPKLPCLHPMRLTQTTAQACIEFEGLTNKLCWDTTKPGWWTSDPTSWEGSTQFDRPWTHL